MRRITIDNFRDYTRDRFVDAQTRASVTLAPTLLLTNESGVEGDLREELSETHWSKVVFDIPSAAVQGAELLFYVNEDTATQQQPMRLIVNGHGLAHRQHRDRMLTGGWDRASIPAHYLQDGKNEFIFADSGVLHVDPGPGGASSRSFDSGKTWHTGALGPDHSVQGEYLVRLRLRGYPPAGQLTSPVIDLADPERQGVIAPHLQIKRVALTCERDVPQGTSIQFELRSGTTPAFDPTGWTPWAPTASLRQPGRYVQWRATLSTQSADTTPVLRSVTLAADVTADKTSVAHVELLHLEQPELVRGSYAFVYMTPHHRLTRLRQQYRLDEVVAAGKTELERLALLRDWVHSQWWGWQYDTYHYCPPWDPLEILEVTKGNWGFGMCTHYAAVLVGCAAALGYVARVVIIDHHCLAEVWSDELQKWVLQDAGPCREFDATYELAGEPLNALEVHNAVVRGDIEKLQANKLPQQTVEPMDREVAGYFCRFGIPLRNNHLIYAEPAELRHGHGHYHYNGYLWWSDDIDPKYPEYSLQTSRPGDCYWSVNQTRLYLQAGETADALRVDLETVTPNFSHYLVQIDDGAWQEGTTPFQWSLHTGKNSLAVRSVNVFGKRGCISRAKVIRRHGQR